MEASNFQPKNTGKKQLFDNPVLEKLTRTHISVPLFVFYGISAFLLFRGFVYTELSPFTIIGVFISAILFFTLVEYIMHRHVFHMLPTNKLKKDIAYNFHGVHHEYPKDKSRLVMPPVVSITLAAILFFGIRFVIGDYVYAFLPGFLTGYASYLAVHYIVHAYRPPKNIFKVLWVHHGIHHYKENDRAFGVSSPLWDYIFRTMPRTQ
ncbi:sterol desaturase family protein [Chondrinema litorale]|uniref:sterol desaturase family protein n=1 Tax=Chondrinema litorale TaxID=2994555 RepID=UPI00254291FF|nr:sterol desaturase family protein [Chondrinema litorale]UZR94902.1 sterol desaturase family protein [Chondrinema litorale]